MPRLIHLEVPDADASLLLEHVRERLAALGYETDRHYYTLFVTRRPRSHAGPAAPSLAAPPPGPPTKATRGARV